MQLEQLVYVSRSVVPLTSLMEVSDILEQSTRNNPGNNITGALGFTETHFIQILEGSHSSLDVLLLKLLIDERHTYMEILDREPILRRSFAAWAMISPKVNPAGQRQLTALLADDSRSVHRYRDTMLDLCAGQMNLVSAPHSSQLGSRSEVDLQRGTTGIRD